MPTPKPRRKKYRYIVVVRAKKGSRGWKVECRETNFPSEHDLMMTYSECLYGPRRSFYTLNEAMGVRDRLATKHGILRTYKVFRVERVL